MADSTSGVIIIGGGVAGMAAAGVLGRNGIPVTLLEGRERLGGRISTIRPKGWPAPVELGAEFVHEGNDEFWALLRRHRIPSKQVPQTHWQKADTLLSPIADVETRIGGVTDRIKPQAMKTWSFARFMRKEAKSIAPADRALVTGFVEGFEAAPTDQMSAAAMQGETLDTSEQFSLPSGYDALIDALAADMKKAHANVHLDALARGVLWHPGAVKVLVGRKVFVARALIVTVPLGVLKASGRQRGAIRFEPPLREKAAVIARMHMGHVIRLTMRFDERRWPVIVPAELRTADRSGFGFIHTRVEGVPVWWALSGNHVLTGWAGGPAALALADYSSRALCEKALASLSEIFRTPKRALRRALRGCASHNWSRDPLSRGAYSFIAAGQEGAPERLRQPVNGTIFFAGEATADGAEVGTVHGALSSGLRAAKEVLAAVK